MPVTQLTQLSPSISFALWKIDESLEEFMTLYPLSKADEGILNEQKVLTRKMEWLAARLALKSLLNAQNLGPLAIVKDEFGKPHLEGSHIHISISHTKGYGAAVINAEGPVGIDIEYPKPQIQRIAHKFLHSDEKAWAGDNVESLTQIWSAKEAMYKLHGRTQLTFSTQLYVEEPKSKHPTAGVIIENGQRDEFQLSYDQFDGIIICLAF